MELSGCKASCEEEAMGEEGERRGRGEKEERERRLVMVSYIVGLPMQWHLPMLPPRQKKCISSS